MLLSYGIRSLVGFGNRLRPLVHLVLYPRKKTHNAAPKDISERTSYLQVWLAFHSYPQVIQSLFTATGSHLHSMLLEFRAAHR